MSIVDFCKNKKNEEKAKIKENKSNIKCDENLGIKKSPSYYLKLQEKDNQNKVNNQKIDQIADNITQNISSNYRIVFFCCIKYILLNGKHNKQELLNEFNTMYLKEKLEKVKATSKLYESQIRKFLDIEEGKRKKIIEEASCQMQLIEWKSEEEKQEQMEEIIDKEFYEIIQNTEDIYLECKYTTNKTRIMYLYKEGLVLAFDIENEHTVSTVVKINKEKFNFIENFLAKGIKNQEVKDPKSIIMINNQTFNCDASLFHIVLLLITEQEKIDEKLFLKYESYLSKSEHRMMKNEEKKNKYLFINWYPNGDESENIKKMCLSIIQNIELNLPTLDLADLKYYAQYYYEKKMYKRAIMLYERMAELGVDVSYYQISKIYKKQKEYELAKQYAKRTTKFVSIYKKLTEKECYRIIIDNEKIPNITDSKMYGNPYLPVGEKYPVTKDGKPLNLIIQINLKDINLEGFPTRGIVEVFADANSRNPEYEIRYYEDITLENQSSFPNVEDPKYSIIDKLNVKLNFEKEYTYMPILNTNYEKMLKRTIELYNNHIGEKLYDYNNELDCYVLNELISEIDLFPLLIGGYADYANTDYYANSKKESMIKLMSNTGGDEYSINVLISKKDLEDKKFEKALLIFED